MGEARSWRGQERKASPAVLDKVHMFFPPSAPQLFRPLDESFMDDELTHEEPPRSLQPHPADSRGPDTLWLPVSGR